jgi:serine phosphatase RsbU (regulator of sigma subunit)
MSDPDFGTLLHAVAPDHLPEALRTHLQREHGAGQVEILLPDYTLTRLLPIFGTATDPASTTRCFSAQQVVIGRGPGGRTTWQLPLTVWGERLGVLVVEPGPADPQPLNRIADQFAIALRAAGPATDRYRRVRRQERLTMAAELQWDLLPGHSLGDERFQLAGRLEPAYAVCGDHFDFSLDGDRLTVTVLNGQGKGMDAAVLTGITVNAMRNARRSGANIVEQAELAAEAVHGRYAGALHVSTLLLEIDLQTGTVDAVDAGSPQALIARGGQVRIVTLEQQLPIGMFADSRYETQRLQLEPADRLLVLSDGVHAAAPGGRPTFGESALHAAIRRIRLQPAADAVGALMRTLGEYHGEDEPGDDAVIVCLDWRGLRLDATS